MAVHALSTAFPTAESRAALTAHSESRTLGHMDFDAGVPRMDTYDAQPSPDSIAGTLSDRAVALWGSERAEELRDLIQETAQRVWLISQDPPPADEEPGFYL